MPRLKDHSLCIWGLTAQTETTYFEAVHTDSGSDRSLKQSLTLQNSVTQVSRQSYTGRLLKYRERHYNQIKICGTNS